MLNILNLNEFEVLKVETNDHYYRITVEKKDKPDFCTYCMWDTMQNQIFEEYKGKEFKLHSSKERIVSDISMHGKAVKIIIKHKRYKCPLCDKTFYEMLESVERNDKVTIRLKEHIKQLSLKKPFLQLAEEFGISHQSVRRYFLEFVKEQEKDKILKAPRVIGIDEAHWFVEFILYVNYQIDIKNIKT